jgi:putative ABC transport system permease protein
MSERQRVDRPPLSRIRGGDLLPQASIGLRTRPVRAALSALGIAIGIAAIVAILGVTRSSQSDLLATIDRLGTDLLTVADAPPVAGEPAELPATAALTVARTDGVRATAATAALTGPRVYRTDRIPAYRTNGLSVHACDASLLRTLDVNLAHGAFLNSATSRYPAAVLGHDAAQQLGIAEPTPSTRIYLSGTWFRVIGILQPVELAPEIDSAALIGFPVAHDIYGYDGHPTRIYVRTEATRTAEVAPLLSRAANPQRPDTVAVSRPSDALAARLAAANSGTALFLGLGAIALLVGGIGIANTMAISVLERRSEIGLRRALGAARRHVAAQFLTESLLLAAIGGAAGCTLGIVVTHALALHRGWQPLIPATAVVASLGVAILVGTAAGMFPAHRAARQSPTEALRTG